MYGENPREKTQNFLRMTCINNLLKFKLLKVEVDDTETSEKMEFSPCLHSPIFATRNKCNTRPQLPT